MPDRQSQVNGQKHAPRSAGKARSATSARARPRREAEPEGPPSRSALGAAAEAVFRAGSLQSQTRSALEEQRRVVTGSVHKVRDALHNASQLVGSEHETVARYLSQAGKKAEDVADYIGNADLRTLRSDAERLARANPGWFVGGAVALGFVLGRLVKASGPELLPAAITVEEDRA